MFWHLLVSRVCGNPSAVPDCRPRPAGASPTRMEAVVHRLATPPIPTHNINQEPQPQVGEIARRRSFDSLASRGAAVCRRKNLRQRQRLHLPPILRQ